MLARFRITGFCAAIGAAAALAACGGTGTLPSPAAGTHAGSLPLSRSAPENAVPFATASKIPLHSGDSIGVNTFPDGDTASGGQGQTVDGFVCRTHLGTGFHIHVHLSIFDENGNQIMVPWGIGIVPPWTF